MIIPSRACKPNEHKSFHKPIKKPKSIKPTTIAFLAAKKWLRQCPSFSKGPQHQPSSPTLQPHMFCFCISPLFLGPSTPAPRSLATIRMKVQSPSVATTPTGLLPAVVTSVPPSSQVVVIWVLFPFPSSRSGSICS